MKKEDKSKKIEILAPAGSFECLKAAVCAGADAIYLGGEKFGARAFAENFTEPVLIEAIEYAHLYGRKIYLTVNTLLKDTELSELYEYLLPFYRHGLDAVIVQDIGVFSYVRRQFPLLPVHISTQATVTDAETAMYYKEKGATRIVPARELSLDEIRRMKNLTGMEIECFVHGALCYCYSGMCLLSSYIGGRSGNRGQCAQPCRLPYSISGKQGDYLSLKDLCTISMLPELIDAGIDSFKIEGRMKQPEYVYTVTRLYRKYADLYLQHGKSSFRVTKEDEDALKEVYRRRGYTDGYYKRHNGKEMISLSAPAAEHRKDASAFVLPQQKKLDVRGLLRLRKGSPASLTIHDQDTHVTVNGDICEKALNRPTTRDMVEKQMKKTGNTPFSFSPLQIEMEEDLFLPVQKLNDLRRKGLELLQDTIVSAFYRESVEASPEGLFLYGNKVASKEKKDIPCQTTGKQLRLSALVHTREQLEKTASSSALQRIYIDSELYLQNRTWVKSICERETKKDFYLAMPYIFRDPVKKVFEPIDPYLASTFAGVLVRNREEILWLRKQGFTGALHGDYTLYAYNTEAAEMLREMGLSLLTAPTELHERELYSLDMTSSMISVYGYQPAMVTANCLRRTSSVCQKNSDVLYLTDRYKKKMPVRLSCPYCYNVIYNSTPLSLLHLMDAVKKLHCESVRFDFTVEEGSELDTILQATERISAGDCAGTDTVPVYTTGHFRRGMK